MQDKLVDPFVIYDDVYLSLRDSLGDAIISKKTENLAQTMKVIHVAILISVFILVLPFSLAECTALYNGILCISIVCKSYTQ